MKVTTSLRLHIALFSDEVPLSGQSHALKKIDPTLGMELMSIPLSDYKWPPNFQYP
jgi:hypothetical protein